MRKNDARKWLHAVLDLLPVILIPVFMIYSHRHTIDSYSVQYGSLEPHTMPQYIYNGLPSGDDNIVSPDYTFSTNNDEFVLHYTPTQEDDGTFFGEDTNVLFNGSGSLVLNNKYFYTFDSKFSGSFLDIWGSAIGFDGRYDSSNLNRYRAIDNTLDIDYSFEEDYVTYNGFLTCTRNDFGDFDGNLCFLTNFFFAFESSSDYVDVYFRNIMLVNLTELYGTGNEPITVEDYLSDYPNSYYDYDSVFYVPSDDYVVYNDPEITSQFTYALYNTIDKYFNFGNIFNLGQVYNWFSINIFNGNPPLVVPMIWNIVLYEFIMDLIFLLYALFMFFIDFCVNLVDRFHTKCSGGK